MDREKVALGKRARGLSLVESDLHFEGDELLQYEPDNKKSTKVVSATYRLDMSEICSSLENQPYFGVNISPSPLCKAEKIS